MGTVAEEQSVYRNVELKRSLRRLIPAVSPNVSMEQVVEFLVENSSLQRITLKSEGGYAPIQRLASPGASPFELALSLKANSYLCHATAVFLHGLTEHIPQTIYVNAEQSAKPRPQGTLTQAGIDRAFRGRQRSSRYSFVHAQHRFVLLSGKQTACYGVELLPRADTHALRVTDIERTLIDITVRPVYGGGVHAVLEAFVSASSRLSVPKLMNTLRALDYVYPYHQALGFYLERAGIPRRKLDALRSAGAEFDFYLAHGLKNPSHDRSWRVFYPKRL